MKKYFIQTFGCAMNQADSEKINMVLLQSGFMKVTNLLDADLVIFNTCSVRQKGEDKVFGAINDIAKENRKRKKTGGKQIVVGITGCMVRKTGINGEYLEDYKRDRNNAKKINLLEDKKGIFNNDDKLFPRLDNKLDFVLRIEEVKYLPFIMTHILKEPIGKDHSFDDYLKSKQLRENPSQATIIIQTGCDNYCTYCIVPYTRGKENSRPIEDIVKEAKDAVKSGAKEITLVGQNVNSYGKQFANKKFWNEEKSKWGPPPNPLLSKEGEGNEVKGGGFKTPFRELLEKINKIEGLKRIRFTSSNPHDMTQDILDAHFELDKMCNYLHFALQSGSDEMLKKMNRRHTYTDFKNMVDYLRSKDPNFSISTDIIVGFSGETDEMFKQTVKAFKECQFDFVYNARYSVRKGTIAEKLYPDNVSDTIKAERWHTLNDLLLDSITTRNSKLLGKTMGVLICGEKDGDFFGRTRNFKEIYFPKLENIKIGDIVNVKVEELNRYNLKGTIIS